MSPIINVTDVTLPNPDHVVRRKARDAAPLLAFLGVIALANGAGSGMAWMAAAVVSATPWVVARVRVERHHSVDAAVAAETVAAAQRGQGPMPVAPSRMAAHARYLERGEACFVDGVPATLLSYYGDPSVVTARSVVAWGGPLVWVFTIIANLMFWRHNAKRRRAAAPRWRDPEPARLWVTDRRFVLRGTRDGRWIQIPFPMMDDVQVEADGVSFTLPDQPTPLKVVTAAPQTVHTLYTLGAHRCPSR